MTNIPQSFNCNYTISIPVGFIARINIKASLRTNDSVYIFDSFHNNNRVGIVDVNKGAEYNFGPPTGTLRIITSTNMSKLLIDLKFIDVDGTYMPRNYKTGEPAALSTARDATFVFAASTPNEKVSLTPCFNYSSLMPDQIPWSTFVYDGSNAKAPLIGTLDNGVQSSGQYLTILNPYGNTFDNYKCWSLGRQKDYSFTFSALKTVAYTFLAMNNDEIYINKLGFSDKSTGSVSFNSLSPTESNRTILTYSKQSTNCLPQLIPSTRTTMILSQDTISLDVSLNRGDYNKPFVGRCGYVYSPSEWDGRQKAGFSFYLDDSSAQYTFQTAVQELKLTAPGENLQIWSRTTSGAIPLNLTYANTVNDQPGDTLVGNRLEMSFNSNSTTSLAKVYFNIQKSSFSATFGGFLSAMVLAMAASIQ
ncbi:unnamed protein product [Caenorhabditis auriculariae]|uniref:CUB-like domain-containing protein n=1 Tax=Caenorhabditis auriculariae TaxID=2777116 RepID=A0A8S1HQZ6_9PELO|nr:unnamed protein product [Caenorhabditis auriculariae]